LALASPSSREQRQAPAFIPDDAEIRRRASPGCPPALVELAIQCCRERPEERPFMSYVLAQLREIEREVCARLDDGAEHVGSIKVLQHTGKRAMPSFRPADKGTKALAAELADASAGSGSAAGGGGDADGQRHGHGADEGDTEGEEDVKQMEVDALQALAGLKIDGKGATVSEMTVNDGKQTWRTARWDERGSVMSQFMDASEIRGESVHTGRAYGQDTSVSYLRANRHHRSERPPHRERTTLPPSYTADPSSPRASTQTRRPLTIRRRL
jgi:LIM domain kinase 1